MTNVLFRQVHPAHIKGELSSAAFRPTPRDEDKMSVDCSSLTTAEDSYDLHRKKTRTLASGDCVALETAGTWAVDRKTCTDELLCVVPDPIAPTAKQPANPAHHLVDFSQIRGNPKRKNDTVAKRLKQNALKYGRLWPK